MKLCPSCKVSFASDQEQCPTCGFEPASVQGIDVYAADFTIGSGGFKPEYFDQLARLEAGNFWFQGRNRLILWAMKKFCNHPSFFLEVGCGTGFVLSGIVQQFPETKAIGSEIFIDGLSIAAERVPTAKFIQMDARNIPYVDEFDVVGAFDVIEHIEEDELVLGQLCRSLRKGGMLMLTVPQHKWLWSQADVYACHQRRYSAKELHQKVQSAGFSIVKSTSFVSTLLPAMIVSRMLDKNLSTDDFDSTKELQLPKWMNAIFLLMLNFEILLIRLGVCLPIGGTRLLVARKL